MLLLNLCKLGAYLENSACSDRYAAFLNSRLSFVLNFRFALAFPPK
jgi:hypothetical protein